MTDLFLRLFNRYTVVVVWASNTGITSQCIRFFGRTAAVNAANGLLFTGQGRCAVSIIGPHGGLV